MVASVVIKLGGGLITDKSSLKTPRFDVIDSISDEISRLVFSGNSVIIVHGAGSFGHLLAKKWSLSEGLKEGISSQQRKAVQRVRSDMLELSGIVTKSLNERGVETVTFPPSEWAENTGASFKGDISFFGSYPRNVVPVTFGDVVKVEGEAEFGILSGDDLMARISIEIPSVTHSIFLLGDTDGMMDKPPNVEGSKLIKLWKSGDLVETEHKVEQDVTGGIELKADRASIISEKVDDVWFINGNNPKRVSELIRDGTTIGTKIVS